MPEPLVTLELILRGIAIGGLAAAGIGAWRVASQQPTGLSAVLLCITAIAHVIENSSLLLAQLGALGDVVNLISLGSTGFVWLFVVTLFEDRPIGPATLGPTIGLVVLGLVAFALPDQRWIWLLHKICQGVVGVHALAIIVATRREDLVEARARIRTPFLALVALYVPLMVGLHVVASFGWSFPHGELTNAAALAAIGLAGAAIFLHAPAELLGVVKPREAPATDAPDRAALEQLNAAMDGQQAWRSEGLTIAGLAETVGVPEHRLRRLINHHLGYRNFAAFVNARRIEAAKAVLRDPAQARTTIAAIAYDLGFGSLGPFNRAFKEATGLTPTEFRRGEPSPNPENPL